MSLCLSLDSFDEVGRAAETTMTEPLESMSTRSPRATRSSRIANLSAIIHHLHPAIFPRAPETVDWDEKSQTVDEEFVRPMVQHEYRGPWKLDA